MTGIITEDQARQATGGHKPLVPVEYEQAIAALVACTTLDEAKYWDNKADALAAWAKIYHSDDAERKAKLLKLHAFRRIGQLATELRPPTALPNKKPGPVSLLQETGFTPVQARSALFVSRLPEPTFVEATTRKHIPAPGALRHEIYTNANAWTRLGSSASGMYLFRAFTRNNSAADTARGVPAADSAKALAIVRDIAEWCDEFEQHLPKPVGGARK